MTIGNCWQAASIFPTIGKEAASREDIGSLAPGPLQLQENGLGFLARGRGVSSFRYLPWKTRGHAWLETNLYCSAAHYFACQRGCYETTPFSPCHYWTKYTFAPGTLRIVFGAWEPWRVPSAPLRSLGTGLAPSPRVSLQRLPGLQQGCFRWVETIPALPPSLCPWRGWKSLHPHMHAWEWMWGHRVAMPGCAGGLAARRPQGLQAGALRQMKSEAQMRKSKSRRGQM